MEVKKRERRAREGLVRRARGSRMGMARGIRGQVVGSRGKGRIRIDQRRGIMGGTIRTRIGG